VKPLHERAEDFAGMEPDAAYALMHELAQGALSVGDREGAKHYQQLADDMAEYLSRGYDDSLPWDEPAENTAQASPEAAGGEIMPTVGKTTVTAMQRLTEAGFDGAAVVSVLEASGYKVVKVAGTRRKAKAIPTFTREEVESILAELGTSLEDVRNRALIEFLWETGARIGEALDMSPEGVEVMSEDMWMVHIPETGKTGARDVPVVVRDGSGNPTPFTLAFEAWSASRPASPILFCTRYGTPVHRNSFNRSLQTYASKAGVVKPEIHSHMFRHTAATRWLAAGMPESYVQQYLGHKSMDMTNRYVEKNTAHIAKWMLDHRK
jgi:integrase